MPKVNTWVHAIIHKNMGPCLCNMSIYNSMGTCYHKATRLIQSNADEVENLRTSIPYTCEELTHSIVPIGRKMNEAAFFQSTT